MKSFVYVLVAIAVLQLPFAAGDVDDEEVHHHVRREAETKTCQCIPLVKHTLYEHNTNLAPDHELGCELLPSTPQANGRRGIILKLEGLDNLPLDLQANLDSGNSILTIPGAVVTNKSIAIPKNARCSLDRITSSSNGNNLFRWNETSSRRNLSNVDKRRILVVRVIAGDKRPSKSRSELSQDIFFDSVNLVTQFRDCSFGKQLFVPAVTWSGDDPNILGGVYQVKVSWSNNQDILERRVINKLNNKFDKADLPSLAGSPVGDKFDHVMFCFPPGVADSSGKTTWAGYAYLNGWLSVYNDNYCSRPSVQMHELGHNLDLRHSGKAISPASAHYEDRSCMMGIGVTADDGPKMCFNAAKSWTLGWYSDKAIEVSPVTDGVWNGRLHGIVDYGNGAAKTVLVRVNTESWSDYFMLFNRATGFNAGVREGPNNVRIVQDNVRTSDGRISINVASLDQPGQHVISSSDFGSTGVAVRITVNEINSSPTSPWYADVTIARRCNARSDCTPGSGSCVSVSCRSNWCECDTSSTAPSPTPRPTPKPTPAPSPKPSSATTGTTVETLFTTTVTDNGSNGNMFDVRAKNDMAIVGFDIHVNSGDDVRLYMRQGGFSGAEGNSRQWTRLALGPYSVSSGTKGVLTSIPLASPLGISSGSVVAFYITMANGKLYYTNGKSVGAIYRQDSNLIVYEGLGMVYEFSTSFRPRVWNGKVNYVLGNGGLLAPNGSFSLLTTTANNNRASGNFFDIEATSRKVEILGFHINPESNNGKLFTAEVYTKVGTYVGFEQKSGAWTRIQKVEIMTGTGDLTALPPLTTPLVVSPGIHAFYINLIGNGLLYTNGSGEGDTFVADDYIRICEGRGVSGTFGSNTFAPRVWNGRIVYSLPNI